MRLREDKWKLTIEVLLLVGLIILAKLVVHQFGLEFLTLSTLFEAIIFANVFLIGFIISGILVDYKEADIHSQ